MKTGRPLVDDHRASVPAEADVQALIAEARARARRRRRRVALGVIAGLAGATALVVTLFAFGIAHGTWARLRLVVPAGPTGVVTGHLAACIGPAPLPGRPAPVTPGTVTVVRGQANWLIQSESPGESQPAIVVPSGDISSEHISNNYSQVFRFVLPPGRYTLVGRFDGSQRVTGFANVTVAAGKTVRADVGNMCL